MNYSERLKDPRWQKKRLEIFERDDWQCRVCRDKTSTLHVHHKIYSGYFPWEADDKYLVTLCENCHDREKYDPYNLIDTAIKNGSYRVHIYELLLRVNLRIKGESEPLKILTEIIDSVMTWEDACKVFKEKGGIVDV